MAEGERKIMVVGTTLTQIKKLQKSQAPRIADETLQSCLNRYFHEKLGCRLPWDKLGNYSDKECLKPGSLQKYQVGTECSTGNLNYIF